MTEEEISKAVEANYLEFVAYMKNVEGFSSVVEMSQLKEWEYWKERKRLQIIKEDVHQLVTEWVGQPDD